jgi:ATP dependent DNA ligase-like protein
VSKRADATYRSGRTEAWVKVKCWNLDRFVVVGFVPDGAGGLAKLRLARREGRALVYAGRVGIGWDHKTARAIRQALTPLARSTSPLSKSIRNGIRLGLSRALMLKLPMRTLLMTGWCGTRRSNASLLELHRAAPITSAKRLSPRGLLGMPNPYKGGAEEKPA